MMHASNDHSCLKEKSSWLSVTFFFMSEDGFILFHFIGVQEELFQRSTTATLQRPGATFEFTGDVYCQASNEEVNMRPCAIFPKIYWTPELPTRKQHDFTWFLPHPNMENQPISHSAINTWHMVNSEIGVGQLAWI